MKEKVSFIFGAVSAIRQWPNIVFPPPYFQNYFLICLLLNTSQQAIGIIFVFSLHERDSEDLV